MTTSHLCKTRPPNHDIALLCEVGHFVAVAISRENEPDLRRRGHAIRNKARKAIGQSGPPPKVKVKTPPQPPKRQRRGGLVYTAKSERKPLRVPPLVETAPRVDPRPVPGERLCHACLREDAKQRDQWAKRLATQGAHGAAGREAAEADRLRALLVAPNKDCRFHARRRQQRRATPEPTVRPPGIFELAQRENADA